jgi:hypothetical protein
MSEINDGGPAFPVTFQHMGEGGSVSGCEWGGMMLRDYFAAKAMLGLIEGYDYELREKSQVKTQRTGFDDTMHEEEDSITYQTCMAREAYMIADAMIRARAVK